MQTDHERTDVRIPGADGIHHMSRRTGNDVRTIAVAIQATVSAQRGEHGVADIARKGHGSAFDIRAAPFRLRIVNGFPVTQTACEHHRLISVHVQDGMKRTYALE